MTRVEARMVAEELAILLRKEIVKAAREVAEQSQDEWLNAREAAEYLGWKISTLYNRIADVPHTKIGKHLKFSKNELNKFIRYEIC